MSTLIKCPNGHYYDSEKYGSCPYCEGAGFDAASEMTAPMPGLFDGDVSATIPDTSASVTVADADFDKTIGMAIWDGSKEGTSSGPVTPVVGWLVCKKGSEFGKSFELKAGRNFIGRSDENDVAIRGDQAISRKEHAIIVFDPKSGQFHAQPGSSSELFYLNDAAVLQVTALNDRDVISLGNTELIFVAFCGVSFSWEDQR